MPPSRTPFLSRTISLRFLGRFGKSHPMQPSLDFSLTGLIYCSMMMFLGLAAMNTQANLLFGVFGLMIGILVVSGFISRAMLKKIELRRSLPKHGIVAEPMIVDYQVTNAKQRWPSLSIRLVELGIPQAFVRPPECYLLHAAPNSTANIPVEMIPRRRGLIEFDHFQIGTSFPFGFIKRASVSRHKESLCIFPPLAEVNRDVLAMSRSADNMGEPVRPRGGGVDEFYGLHEFRAGDNPRNIYWRRSARTGVLVAKDMMRVSPPRIQILVDTWLPDDTLAARAEIERVIAMAASLASMTLQQELAVGVIAWSGSPITIAPTRGKQHREELLTLLARLPTNTTFSSVELVREGEWLARQGTTLVILTARELDLDLPESSRGGIVVLPASSQRIRGWFRFRPNVNFEQMAQAEMEATRAAES